MKVQERNTISCGYNSLSTFHPKDELRLFISLLFKKRIQKGRKEHKIPNELTVSKEAALWCYNCN